MISWVSTLRETYLSIFSFLFLVFLSLASQNRSSLGTRYYWPWEDEETGHDEGTRVDRTKLVEFFTAAQNHFLSGPPRK